MNLPIILLLIASTPTSEVDQVSKLRDLVYELRQEVALLKNQNDDQWLTQKRADEIRELVHDVLADADVRPSLLGDGMTAGYKNGAFLASADGSWKLKINWKLQVRWNYNKAESQTSFHGFEQRRAELKFSGNFIDQSWTFGITPTWPRAGGSAMDDAWIAKSFDNGSWFKLGQFKPGFLREYLVSSGRQQAVDRSMLQNAFTYGRTQGVAVGWKNEELNVSVTYGDGPNQPNTAALVAPTNAWVLRGEMKFGEVSWKDFGSFTSKSGLPNGLMIGAAYENYDTDNGFIEYGNALADKSRGWTVDASLRGDGWSVFSYIVHATGEDKATGVTQDSSGWLVQGGFLVSDNVELFAQYQKGEIDNAVFAGGQSNDMDVFRFGFNYWPRAGSNNLKWSTDVAWGSASLADGAASSGIGSADWVSSGNGWRRDVSTKDNQMLFRTQLQLLF